MIEIEVSVQINVSAGRVWAELSDFATHPEWMDDALAIRFTGSKREGIGTTFECDTKVWFFNHTDEMLVTQWNERRNISITHKGAFTGAGKFTLTPGEDGVTTFTWNEQIAFPWYFGGVVGELIARPVLTRLWSNDVQSMKAKAEGPRGVNPLAFFAEQNARIITKHTEGRWVTELRDADGTVTKTYSAGKSAFAARLAAVTRWKNEH